MAKKEMVEVRNTLDRSYNGRKKGDSVVIDANRLPEYMALGFELVRTAQEADIVQTAEDKKSEALTKAEAEKLAAEQAEAEAKEKAETEAKK